MPFVNISKVDLPQTEDVVDTMAQVMLLSASVIYDDITLRRTEYLQPHIDQLITTLAGLLYVVEKEKEKT